MVDMLDSGWIFLSVYFGIVFIAKPFSVDILPLILDLSQNWKFNTIFYLFWRPARCQFAAQHQIRLQCIIFKIHGILNFPPFSKCKQSGWWRGTPWKLQMIAFTFKIDFPVQIWIKNVHHSLDQRIFFEFWHRHKFSNTNCPWPIQIQFVKAFFKSLHFFLREGVHSWQWWIVAHVFMIFAELRRSAEISVLREERSRRRRLVPSSAFSAFGALKSSQHNLSCPQLSVRCALGKLSISSEIIHTIHNL